MVVPPLTAPRSCCRDFDPCRNHFWHFSRFSPQVSFSHASYRSARSDTTDKSRSGPNLGMHCSTYRPYSSKVRTRTTWGARKLSPGPNRSNTYSDQRRAGYGNQRRAGYGNQHHTGSGTARCEPRKWTNQWRTKDQSLCVKS